MFYDSSSNINRHATRVKNPGGGGHIVMGGDNVPPPMVEIGLTDLSKSGGGGHVPPRPPTLLHA